MRALTERERTILEAMLTDESTTADSNATLADRRRWLAQVPVTFAGRGCECGTCPSIVLTDIDGHTPGTYCITRVVLEASATDGYLLLFIEDDQLSYLEFAPWGDTPVLEFPDLQDTTLRAVAGGCSS